MAVGTSNMLESNMMEGENFYIHMETATEPDSAMQSQWTDVKNDTGQLCRVCGNSVGDDGVPIYEGQGREHQLEFKIQKHLPIQVSITDVLPLQLCYQCASTLIVYDGMVSNCLEVEKKLKAIHEAAEEVSRTVEEYDDSHLDTAPDADSDDEPLIQSKTKLLSEKSKATPIKKKILSKAKTRSVTIKTDKTATDSKEGEDKERLTSNDLKTRGILRAKRSPSVESPTPVNLKEESLIKEEPRADLVENYKCNDCDKNFTSEKLYERHQRTHYPLGLFICHVCGKALKKKGALVRHVRNVHEGRRDWLCDLCGKGFPERSVRDDHRRTHTGECPYVCHTCGKTFKTMASLCIHSKVHVNSFPHECPYCPGKFRWKTQLNGHLTTHTGEKKHKCEVCGKAFGVKCDLNRHRHVHSDEKPFSCSLCGCNFSQKRYLKKHEKARHRNDPPVYQNWSNKVYVGENAK